MNLIKVEGSMHRVANSRTTMDERDFNAVERACEIDEFERVLEYIAMVERRAVIELNVVILAAIVACAFAFAMFAYFGVRDSRSTFMDRMREEGGSSAVSAVMRSDNESFVRACNSVSNAVFGRGN